MRERKPIKGWAIVAIPIAAAVLYVLAATLEFAIIDDEATAAVQQNTAYLAEVSMLLIGILVLVTYGVVGSLLLLRRIVNAIEKGIEP